MKRLSMFLGAGTFLLICLGCGSQPAELSGVVTIEGKPVRSGHVIAVGEDGLQKIAKIDSEGKYHLNDVRSGPVKLAVISPNPANQNGVAEGGRGRPMKENPPPPPSDSAIVKDWFAIPVQYQLPDQSGLAYELKAGANTYNILIKEQAPVEGGP